ncbi:UNVERIFIED_CONTAM: hypothetical protein Sradi_5249800 [Sesamum radiatum]|uniref:Reverse transcriptase domain-containing protein n=1 Tax=Sesamum radiatum TaxID=300843 RepID=A0AAW2LNL6_SESRA
MEEAQAAKKDSRGEEAPSKKPRGDIRDRKPPFQRVNPLYTPDGPHHTSFHGCRGEGAENAIPVMERQPQRPKFDKFCHFHNDYGHTTKECRHLKSEIEDSSRMDTCKNTFVGRRPGVPVLTRRRKETKQGKVRASSLERSAREGAKQTSGSKGENNDIPRKGVIRMIAGGPSGGDSHQARKS